MRVPVGIAARNKEDKYNVIYLHLYNAFVILLVTQSYFLLYCKLAWIKHHRSSYVRRGRHFQCPEMCSCCKAFFMTWATNPKLTKWTHNNQKLKSRELGNTVYLFTLCKPACDWLTMYRPVSSHSVSLASTNSLRQQI